MTLNVVSNYAADVAHRNLMRTDMEASSSLAKLSIGKRVVSARDDAASMAIGQRMNAEVQGLKQAVVNAGQANSMLQIADGAMSTISDILTRMKVLAMQSSSANLGTTERSFLDTEFQALKMEIDRVANDTDFNGTKLINAATTLTFKIGTGTVATEDDLTFSIAAVTAADLGVDGDDITDTTNSATALTDINAAIDLLNTGRAGIGAAQNRLDFASQNLQVSIENSEAARSTLLDLDLAAEMTTFTSKQVLMQSGVAMLAQANQMPQNLLRLLQ
jgi:flagellin